LGEGGHVYRVVGVDLDDWPSACYWFADLVVPHLGRDAVSIEVPGAASARSSRVPTRRYLLVASAEHLHDGAG
jgi:hypothetical protein